LQRRFEEATNVRLPLESIVIAATHTHQGPGNYFSAAVLNNLGSPIKGYVPELREFLIKRIVQAAVTAYRNAQTSTSVQLQTRQALMPIQSLRNRSPETFMLNANADEIMRELDKRLRDLGGIPEQSDAQSCVKAREPREQHGGWDIEGCPRLRAVDRELTVLKVTDAKGPIATLVFGAVHPTVAPAETPLFSSDFVGLAMRRLELKVSSGRLVAAFFNGPEGDITARRIERDVRDIWKHASLMVEAVENAKDPTVINLRTGIESRMHYAAPGKVVSGIDVQLASNAMAGAALLGGGEGDRTPLYQLGFQERVTDFRATSEQGAKLNGLKSRLLPDLPDLTALIAKPEDFPRVLPLAYARLGTLDIVSTPTEMSTATGYAIRKALQSSARTIIIGLANEYASYTATAAEYARQDYMGASTLWGPQESAFIAGVLSKLKHESLPDGGEPKDRPGGSSTNLDPFDVGARRQAVDEDLDFLLRNQLRNPVRNLPYFAWHDEGKIDPYAEASETTVAIESENGSLVEDDSAGRIVVLLREKPQSDIREWAAIWLAPLDDVPPTGRVRFTVNTASGKCYKSPIFDALDKGDRGPSIPVPCRR
jgi:neutral ceramidase